MRLSTDEGLRGENGWPCNMKIGPMGKSAGCLSMLKEQGLPKSSFIRKPWEYERVYQLGRRLRGECFQLVLCPNDKEGNRLGISIHRTIKGAVIRNRIKRIVRECFRLHRTLFPHATDVIMAIRPGFAAQQPDDVLQTIREVLKKAGIVRTCSTGKRDARS